MPDLSAFVPKGMYLNRTYSQGGTTTIRFGTDSLIWTHAQQTDGKVVLGGQFSVYNATNSSGIARIDPTTGELDTTFTTNIGGGATGDVTSKDVYAVAIQPDGKILVSGLFDTFNGVTQQGLVRLNSNGTPDTAFNANVANLFDRSSGDTYAFSIALQSDGKIILGGFWNNGLYDSALTLYNIFYLARLNSNGTIDTTFSSNGTTYPTSTVLKVVVQSDDKILVGGFFTTFSTSGGSVSVSGLARLNANGTLDTTFNTALGTGINTGAVRALALQSDGSVVIGGSFTSFNGTSCEIARVSSTGTFDTSFNTNVGTGIGAGESIFSISVQSDGDILVGGAFAAWNGTTVGDIVRLNSDGTRDTAFTTANGTGSNSASSQIRTVSQLSSGDILATGDSFSSWNGTSVDNIVTLSSAGARNTAFLPKPEIVFAILAGAGGGVPDTASDEVSSGGGAGAVVMGLVPFTTSVVLGSSSYTTQAGHSRYSTLYAEGGAVGVGDASGNSGSRGSGGSGGGNKYTNTSGGRSGSVGSVFFTALGGAGGASSGPSANVNSAGVAGSSGTSGGGGGAAAFSVTSGTGTTTGGSGGSGLVGGGGGGAGTDVGGTAGAVTGGAGGTGLYSGGTATAVTGTNAYRYSSGGGGGGLLGPGESGGSASGSNNSRSAGGNAGGLGGGGAGGGVGDSQSFQGALGGTGCLLLYW